MTTVDEVLDTPTKRPNVFIRIYRGETNFDFVGHRRWWYTLSAIVIIAGVASLGIRGLNLGIDFKGGTSWEVNASGLSTATVQSAMLRAGVPDPTVEILGGRTVQVQADLQTLPAARQTAVKAAAQVQMGRLAGVPPGQVSITDVGATWGSQITNKAILAVIVFFIVVVIYISFRFEWKMALAALIAVIHDLLVTAGVYSLFGLQVTPDTVIAVLTILGYSLYDTVVVFDRVGENTRGLGATGRMTYSDVVNLSMNQTLARSINTSLVAILPVLSVLVIGALILGATTLQYFGLALVIGLMSGAYSSIFIASPLLAQMKEREPRYRTIREKLELRSERDAILTPRAAAQLAGAATASSRATQRSGAARGAAAKRQAQAQARNQAIRPGAAKKRTASAAVADADPDPDELGDDVGDDDAGAPAAASGGNGAARTRPAGAARPNRPSGAARRPPPRKKGKKGGRRR